MLKCSKINERGSPSAVFEELLFTLALSNDTDN